MRYVGKSLTSTMTSASFVLLLAACGAPGTASTGTTARTAAGDTVSVVGQPASAAAPAMSTAMSTATSGTAILGRYSAELEPINEAATKIGALTVRYPDGTGGSVRIDNATYGATRSNLNTQTRRAENNNQVNRDNMDGLALTGAFKPLTPNTPRSGEIYGSYLGPLNFSEADGSGRGPGALSAVETVDGDAPPMTIDCEYVVSKVEPNSGGVCRSTSDDRAKDGGLWLMVF